MAQVPSRLGSFGSRVLRGCVDSVSLRFEFSFMNGSSFEPILGSFWSRMLRGCVPLRFEFSFRNGSSFEPILESFWSRMLRGCVRFDFATFRI